MKTYALIGTLVLFTSGAMCGVAQDAARSSSAKSTASEKKIEKKRVNRLPSNFGKLGLSEAQRDKVYAVQNSFTDQIESLEEQIEALKQKRDKEIDAVLTADQRKTLNDLTEAAKDSKAKSKKGDAEKKTDTGKSEATSGSKEGSK